MVKSIYAQQYKKLVDRLKTARQQSDLTQVQVSKLLRRPQAYVSKIESGVQRLDIVELETFAKLYGKPVHFFWPALDKKSTK